MRNALTILVLVIGALATARGAAAVSPAQIRAQAETEWLSQMRASAANGDRAARFPSPPRSVLMGRLRLAAARYGFRIVSVRMFHPLQAAPLIVIASDRKPALAHALPRVIETFDPRRPTAADPAGFAYEGYFLVAQTSAGSPYLLTFNHWRAPHVGGGEWAESENLYPFPHG